MKWSNALAQKTGWSGEISHYEEKLAVAKKLTEKLKDGDIVGAGSGSTAYVTLMEIARKAKEEGISCKVIPTSREIEMTASSLGLATTSLLCDQPDWCYDGADEVDPQGNLIKGRGGAMYREKLVMRSAKESYILVDSSKFVNALGEKFAIPVELQQEALHYVESALTSLGAAEIVLRAAQSKDGPVITESGNLILDVRFNQVGAELETEIKSITGVIESGLFWGFNPEIVTC